MSNSRERRTKTLRLETDLIKTLEELAVRDNRNFNNFVETILMRETKRQDVSQI